MQNGGRLRNTAGAPAPPRTLRRAQACALALAIGLAGCEEDTHGPSSNAAGASGSGASGSSSGSGGTSIGGISGGGGTTSSTGASSGLSGAAGASVGNKIYVSPSGSDSNPGTAASPVQTPQKAQQIVRSLNGDMAADINVILSDGRYRMSGPLALDPSDSGTNGHQVIWAAAAGASPLLSGAVQITGFTQYDATKNIWRAALPAGAAGAVGRQLYVDGIRAVRARSAGSPNGVTTTATGFTTTDSMYASLHNPSSIEVVQDNDWKHMRCPLKSVASLGSGGAGLNVLPSCWSGNNLSVPNVGFPFNGSGLPAMSGISWVENAYELLTQPGQFYLDSVAAFVYYIPRAGEDLSTADVELPVLETLVSLSGTPGHLTPQNDTDAAVTYSGTWAHATGRGYGDLGDDVHGTTQRGASATFAFSGTGIQILGETNSDEGAFQVYVDGKLNAASFTEAGMSRLAQQVVFSVLGLEKGAHTVEVANDSTTALYTIIDGFVVVPEVVAPVHDITFSGITFAYATWNLPQTVGYIDNQAGVLWDTSTAVPTPTRVPGAVQVHRGRNISFIGDTFSQIGSTALDLADGTQGSTIKGSIIRDTSGGGISVAEVDDYYQTEASLMTSGNTIADNTIAHVGVDYHEAVGIWAGYTRTLTIAHNDIGHTPYSGISLGWGWGWASPGSRCGTNYAGDNQIVANYIHDVMGYLHDGGPIYTNGGQGAANRSTLASNFVTAGNNTNNMLYQDEGSSYWNTHDNVTSLGGQDWIGMWISSIHDITVGPVNTTDNPNTLNNGTNIMYTTPTLVTGGKWPAGALAVMSAAGLEPAYIVSATTIDDDDQALKYAGNWLAAGLRGDGDYEGNVHYTGNNGDTVTLTFTGTGVSFISEKSSDQGEIAWSVDGQAQGTVDTSMPSGVAPTAQQVLFTSATLPSGSHVLQITKNSGSYMRVDAFRTKP
jgi:hypothetical protein